MIGCGPQAGRAALLPCCMKRAMEADCFPPFSHRMSACGVECMETVKSRTGRQEYCIVAQIIGMYTSMAATPLSRLRTRGVSVRPPFLLPQTLCEKRSAIRAFTSGSQYCRARGLQTITFEPPSTPPTSRQTTPQLHILRPGDGELSWLQRHGDRCRSFA